MTEEKFSKEVPGFSGRDVTEMVLRLAHEIRNPLATIKSSLQLIRRLKMSAETALPYLESSLMQIDRIHETMKEIEGYVSLRPGTMGAVHVEEALSRALGSVQGQAKDAGILLSNGGGPNARVAIDPQQFQLVLAELLENALEFSEAGTSIGVAWEKAEAMIRIHVTDQGTGVSDEHNPLILRPFFSTLTQGIGLGLNVSQRLCKFAGGRLEWENRTEGGCRFTIVLREV